ncbi:unnamed protein product, partial [Prorocentrum cordatum]
AGSGPRGVTSPPLLGPSSVQPACLPRLGGARARGGGAAPGAMSASAEAPAEAHGEDSLLSLAREFEQHLGRLSRGSAGEQGRGDGLRARNEQLRERAGLAPASPAKDVEAGAGVAPSSPPTRAEGAAAAPRRPAVEAAAPTPSRPGGALREPLLGHGARQASPSAASGADSTASAGNRLPSVTRLPSQVLHGKVSRSRLQ